MRNVLLKAPDSHCHVLRKSSFSSCAGTHTLSPIWVSVMSKTYGPLTLTPCEAVEEAAEGQRGPDSPAQ